MFLINLLDLFKNGIRLHLRIDVVVLVELTVVFYDFLCLVLVGHEPLLDAFDVVVTPPATLSSL